MPIINLEYYYNIANRVSLLYKNVLNCHNLYIIPQLKITISNIFNIRFLFPSTHELSTKKFSFYLRMMKYFHCEQKQSQQHQQGLDHTPFAVSLLDDDNIPHPLPNGPKAAFFPYHSRCFPEILFYYQ